jgi:hypothetical protein
MTGAPHAKPIRTLGEMVSEAASDAWFERKIALSLPSGPG